jgi:dihydrolipoamide dehydrogenase
VSQNVYKLAVLGGGPGGYVAALRAAQLAPAFAEAPAGKPGVGDFRIALIEERQLGGTCLNRGCIPTKAMLDSVHVLTLARRAEEFGVKASDVGMDIGKMNERWGQITATQRKGVEGLLKRAKVEVIAGRGVLRDKNNIVVKREGGERLVTAEKIILATGSESFKLPGFDFDGRSIITSDDALHMESVPASILIVGGGAIGCEWAGIFSELGAQVTVVEMMDQLLPSMDGDLAKELLKSFKRAGIKVHVKTKVESVERAQGGLTVTLSQGEKVQVERVLVCVGRKLNTDCIGLEAVGVATERMAVVIDEHCRTSMPNIYAVGDITGKLLLAHLASAQGEVAAEHAMGRDSAIDYKVVPSCIFTHPEIGSVGLTSEQAERQGVKVKAAQYPYRPLGRARTLGAPDGMFKIVADADTGEVLGVHIIGASASDLVAAACLAIRLEARVQDIAETIHAHPTLSEGMMELSKLWLGRGIHA